MLALMALAGGVCRKGLLFFWSFPCGKKAVTTGLSALSLTLPSSLSQLCPSPCPCSCPAGNSGAASGTERCMGLALMWQCEWGCRGLELRAGALWLGHMTLSLHRLPAGLHLFLPLLLWKVTVTCIFVMLSAAASRMTCLLLSSNLQIACFWSAASSKDSLNLLNGFPSLAFAVLDHWEGQDFSYSLWLIWPKVMGSASRGTEPCRIRPGGRGWQCSVCWQMWAPVWPGLKPALNWAMAMFRLGILVWGPSQTQITAQLWVLRWILPGWGWACRGCAQRSATQHTYLTDMANLSAEYSSWSIQVTHH